MNRRFRLWLGALAALGLAACGGSGGDMRAPASISPPEPGTVGILLTDAYGTQWDQAFATITSIELIGDESHATIFSGEETIDLLSLADYSELFAVAEIDPDVFAKVRLHLTLLELVDLDDMGVEVERVATKLVGNGKIDINPRGSIVVSSGDTLLIQLDFDMQKFFKTTETHNGVIIVRPVIFARIVTGGESSGMTRVFGTAESVDEDTQSLVLCQTSLIASDDDDDDSDEVEAENGHCIRVATDERTGFFDPDGLPVTFLDVPVGAELTAVGFLRGPDDDSASDDGEEGAEPDGEGEFDDALVLHAIALEFGANFVRYAGTVQSMVDGDSFDFLVGPGQGFVTGTVIATELVASTRVFLNNGTELDQLAIAPEATGLVDGVIALATEGVDDRLRAALIVLDPADDTGEELLSGTILSVSMNEEDNSFQMLVGEMPRCVDANTAEIMLVSEGDGMEQIEGMFSDLAADLVVDVFGEEGIDGCFVATSVLVHGS